MEVPGGHAAERGHDRRRTQGGAEGADRRLDPGEELGHQPDERDQAGADQPAPSPEPPDGAAEPDIGPNLVGCRLEAREALDDGDGRLHLVERPAQPGRQRVGEQAERPGGPGAVSPGDPATRRPDAAISADASEPTAASRVIGAAVEACLFPPALRNVLLAGEPRSESELHRQPRPGRW